MKQMNAIVATGYGNPEVLKVQRVEKPIAQPNEVLVKVYAASATRADAMMLSGKPYIARLFTGIKRPKHPIPGTGFAGKVVAKGDKVTRFNVGDAAFGETTLGFSTNAEYVAVPENGVILSKPENLGYGDAATLCDGPLTSINFLREIARIQPGQKVLINGASGSLGTAAVQLAKYFGAEVTGVCSTKNVGLVSSLGANHVIDYTRENFGLSDKRYDVIYDTVGKSSFNKCKAVLTANGQYISPVLQFPLLLQMLRTSLTKGKKAQFAASGLKKENELRQLLGELLDIIQQGKLKVVVDRQFPLEKVADAHRYISTGHKKGNVVILINA